MSIATAELSPNRSFARGELASFWLRLVAALLDLIVMRVIVDGAAAATDGVVATDAPIVELLYPILFIAYGATPGMRVLKLRVVDSERKRPGFARSLRRVILPALTLWPWVFYFGGSDLMLDVQISVLIVTSLVVIAISILDPLWMIWDAQKQTLHDKLAGTYVIAGKSSSSTDM
jgi:uncharacterized RDD family membrane protein YckC